MSTTLTFSIPVHTVSEANVREHWAKKAKRAKEQRLAAWVLAMAATGPSLPFGGGDRVSVHLVRVGPKELDSDNLARALKAVRDGIADAIGLDDGDKRITWTYGQEKGPRGRHEVLAAMEVTQHDQ